MLMFRSLALSSQPQLMHEQSYDLGAHALRSALLKNLWVTLEWWLKSQVCSHFFPVWKNKKMKHHLHISFDEFTHWSKIEFLVDKIWKLNFVTTSNFLCQMGKNIFLFRSFKTTVKSKKRQKKEKKVLDGIRTCISKRKLYISNLVQCVNAQNGIWI